MNYVWEFLFQLLCCMFVRKNDFQNKLIFPNKYLQFIALLQLAVLSANLHVKSS